MTDLLSSLMRDREKQVVEPTREVLCDPLDSVEAVKAFDATLAGVAGEALDTRLREAGAEVVCCLIRGAPKGPNLPRVRLNHQDALFPGHGKATHSQTWEARNVPCYASINRAIHDFDGEGASHETGAWPKGIDFTAVLHGWPGSFGLENARLHMETCSILAPGPC
ncbi:hypothetical protein HPB47_017407 [Ixodes persulcatus]|uniref:Uncharacterized protein n=1 Tax=Ixodes persulcatus TaxID=34615 RepID=A0AC60QNK3_IXOPE|nr:hypothetical protein HPB47_017407 [Ixodes persulcatus]